MMQNLSKLKKLQQKLSLKQKQKVRTESEKDSSQCSSQTQQLNTSLQTKQKKQPVKYQQQQVQLSQQSSVCSSDQQDDPKLNIESQQKHKTKIQLAYDKKPYIKGARRYYKDGQVYYHTATKHFQPQKHYFYKSESQIIKSWVYGSGKTNQKIKIASWNINGIRNALHKPSVCDYIKNANADILCIIEVKINQWNYKKRPVKLPGYEGYWNFCKCSSGYSGIAIFSKFQPISAFQDFEERQFSQEGRVLTLQYEQFYLVAAYIPTAGQNLQRLEYKVNQYQKVFYKHCTKLLDKKHVIIAGDLNTCHTQLDMHVPKIIRKHQGKHPSSTKKQKANFEKFLNIGFVDTFRRLNPKTKKYSWYNVKRLGREKNLGKRLDYFLVNEEFINCVKKSQVQSDIQGSDHCPIQLYLDLSKLTKQDNDKRQKGALIRQEYINVHFIPKISEQLKAFTEKKEFCLSTQTVNVNETVKKQE